jgi:hypothetical protein
MPSERRFPPRAHRFPPPWTLEEHNDACFIVRDASGQALGYFYFEDEPGRRTAAKLLTRDEALRLTSTLICTLDPSTERRFSPASMPLRICHGHLYISEHRLWFFLYHRPSTACTFRFLSVHPVYTSVSGCLLLSQGVLLVIVHSSPSRPLSGQHIPKRLYGIT